MRILITAFAGLLVTAASAQAAIVEFVQNGGFETVNPATPGQNFEFGASYAPNSGPNAVPGWSSPTVAAYNLIYGLQDPFSAAGNANGNFTYTGKEFIQPGFVGPGSVVATRSPSGGNFAAIDGDPKYSGPLQQTLTGLITNGVYTLTFEWAAAQVASRNGATTDQVQVTANGASIFNTPIVAIPGGGFSGWFSEKVTFVATSATEVLSFLDIGTPTGLPPIALLDAVSVVGPNTNQVPEPAAIAMLGLGLVGLGASRLRRRG